MPLKFVISSKNNKTDAWFVLPSTCKEDFLDNHENQIAEVTQLNLTYEDFSDFMDQSHDQEIVELDPSVHFSTANGKQLPLQTNINISNIPRKRFTEKSPVNVSFIGSKKKMKIQESASSSATINNNNNVQPVLNKNFQCTI